MFVGVNPAPIPYEEPWVVPFEDRLRALSKGERRIAYFYNRPDTSTFRYRVFNMVQAIEGAPELGISASWFSRDDLHQFRRYIDRAHALVICRTLYNADIGRMISHARARGLRVLFDVDDLIFDPDYTHLILDTLDRVTDQDEVWNQWFGWISRTGATLRLCDGAIVTNPFLASRVGDYAPDVSIRVVPNFLNREQQLHSEEIWAAKLESEFLRDDKVHIGYFSGTPTHNRDFAIAASALAQLLDEDPDIELRVTGYLDLREPMLRHQGRIQSYSLQDFLNLQRLVAEVEINIAPLQNNTFTNCKSELKYFEAAIVGTLTVASPSFTFRRAIRDGTNGLLAAAHEWYPKLRSAVEIARESRRYAGIAERAFQQVREAYRWDGYAKQIAAAVFDDPILTSGEESTEAELARGVGQPV